jgi:hypothetical protein
VKVAIRERRETTGWRCQESRGGGGSPRGKREARVAASWGCGLPNDGKICPMAKNDMGVWPKKIGGIPRDYGPLVRGRCHSPYGLSLSYGAAGVFSRWRRQPSRDGGGGHVS